MKLVVLWWTYLNVVKSSPKIVFYLQVLKWLETFLTSGQIHKVWNTAVKCGFFLVDIVTVISTTFAANLRRWCAGTDIPRNLSLPESEAQITSIMSIRLHQADRMIDRQSSNVFLMVLNNMMSYFSWSHDKKEAVAHLNPNITTATHLRSPLEGEVMHVWTKLAATAALIKQ